MRRAVAWLVIALALTGCGKDELGARCDKAVRHVIEGVVPVEGIEQVSSGERAIMQQVVAMSIARCRSEGLSEAQAACILAVRDLDGLMTVGSCPAIRAQKPSWLIAPSAEELEVIERAKAAGEALPPVDAADVVP
jgi:CTP:molybdopterin cytidylyltransferase MocA